MMANNRASCHLLLLVEFMIKIGAVPRANDTENGETRIVQTLGFIMFDWKIEPTVFPFDTYFKSLNAWKGK